MKFRAIPHTASPAGSVRRAVPCLAVVALALAAPKPAGAVAGDRPGTLDPSFAGGTLIRGFGTVPGSGWAIETSPMPDGGFVVRTSGGSIGRYLADGSLDLGFGEDGYLIGVEPVAIATTATGRIYVLGFGRNGPQVSRLLPDSAPDPSFARRGTLYLGQKAPPLQAALATADGGVILAGTNFLEKQVSVGAIRVAADGSVDRNYGSDGVARALYPRENSEQPFIYTLDGDRLTFVAEGNYFFQNGIDHRHLVLGRFGPEGGVDAPFTREVELQLLALHGHSSARRVNHQRAEVDRLLLHSGDRLSGDDSAVKVAGAGQPPGRLLIAPDAQLPVPSLAQPRFNLAGGRLDGDPSEPARHNLLKWAVVVERSVHRVLLAR